MKFLLVILNVRGTAGGKLLPLRWFRALRGKNDLLQVVPLLPPLEGPSDPTRGLGGKCRNREAFRRAVLKRPALPCYSCAPSAQSELDSVNGVEGDVLDVLGELAQFLGVVALDFRHMVDVGAFDQLPLPGAQVLELGPQVGAKGVGAFRAFAGAGQQAVVAGVLIEAADGCLLYTSPSPRAS